MAGEIKISAIREKKGVYSIGFALNTKIWILTLED